MDMQKLFDMLSEERRKTRGQYQMTLGKAIEVLGTWSADIEIKIDKDVYPGRVESYRGYYSDLSTVPSNERATVGSFLDVLKAAVGKPFTGYKGGDFTMGDDTPLWVSYHGSTGQAIMDFELIDNTLMIATKEID